VYQADTNPKKQFECATGQLWGLDVVSSNELEVMQKLLSAKAAQQKTNVGYWGGALYTYVRRQPSNLAPYFENAKAERAEMLEGLSWFYEILKLKLTQFFGAPVELSSDMGLPGFLILKKGLHKSMRPHFDLQHRALPQEIKSRFDVEKHFTFTIPIHLPNFETGIFVWPISFKEIVQLVRNNQNTELKNNNYNESEFLELGFDINSEADQLLFDRLMSYEKKSIIYKPGRMNLMIGNIFHQTYLTEALPEDQSRIVMIGHGVKTKDGTWELYW
jgi:hypothetical protein